MRLTDGIKSLIETDALKRARDLKIDKQANLHILDEVLVPGEKLRAAAFEVPIERDNPLTITITSFA